MANPYNVAIQLALSSNHQQVLGTLAGSLLGIHGHVGRLIKHFDQLKGVIAGAIGVAVGGELINFMVKVGKSAEDLSHQLTALKVLGLGQVDINRAHAEAIRITNTVKGTTEAGNLKMMAQVYEPLGMDATLKLGESIARFEQVVSTSTGKFDKENANNQMYAMIKAGELFGKLSDPQNMEKMNRFLSLGASTITATHGQITPQTWLNMVQRGGPALMNMSDEGLITLAQLSQMMGGHQTGTGMMSLYQQVVGGRMTKATAEGMESIGLLGPYGGKRKPGEPEPNADWWSEGGKAQISPDAKKRLGEMLGTDPKQFAEAVKKAMEEHGITGDAQTNKLFDMIGRQTSLRLVADLLRNDEQMRQSGQRIGGVLPLEAAKAAQDAGDVSQNIRNLTSAWENFKTALAGPNTENIISVLQRITEAISSMTASVRSMDPETLKGLGIGVAALAGAFTVAGAAAMAAALGTGGWMIVGLGALFGIFEAFKPDELKEFVKDFGTALGNIKQTIVDWIAQLRALFGGGNASPGMPGAPGGTVPPSLGNPSGLFTPTSYTPTPWNSGGAFGPPTRWNSGGGFGPPSQWNGGGRAFGPPTQYTPGAMPFRGMRGGSSGGLESAISGSSRSGGGGVQPIIVSLNIDGRKISEALSSSLAELMQFPTQAPYHDTYSGYSSPDNQTAST